MSFPGGRDGVVHPDVPRGWGIGSTQSRAVRRAPLFWVRTVRPASGESPQLSELNLLPDEEYRVLKDVGDLKKDALVKFVGFDDVDNHYGIFVFVDSDGTVLEVSGDCSGPNHSCMTNLKLALSKK